MTNSADQSLLAPQYAKSFRELGVTVYDFFQSDYYGDFNIFDKVWHRIYPSWYYHNINKYLLKQIADIKPDIFLLFKGMEVYPETLRAIKKTGTYLVNYNPDHPFDFVSRGSGNNNVLNAVPLFDLYLTYSHRILKKMKTRYPYLKTAYLPFGYALNEEQFNLIQSDVEINKVGFVGYGDRERARFIESLAKHGMSVDVYGASWKNYFKNTSSRVHVLPSVGGLEYYRVLRKYRVQLNLFRSHNLESHNMRSFEVPAAGGIMLAPDSLEHRTFFENGKEVFLYKDIDQAMEIARNLMMLNREQSEVYRIHARNRSVQSNYDYKSRAITLLNILTKNL